MKIHSLGYFPGCYDPSALWEHGYLTAYPIPKTGAAPGDYVRDFDTIMKWTRRVRVWRLTARMELTWGIQFAELLCERIPNPLEPTIHETEADRICQLGPFTAFKEFPEPGQSPDLIQAWIWIYPFAYTTGGDVWTGPTCYKQKDGDEYFMACRIRVEGTGGMTGDLQIADTCIEQTGLFTGVVPGTFGGLPIEFSGSSISKPLMSDPIVITPAEYFPYADADGSNPVWGPTGALIGDVNQLPPAV